MPVTFVKGGAVKALQNGDVECLLHCCNCQNNFGSGIAKQIKEVFPDAWMEDCDAARKGSNTLGSIVASESGVINLYGQEYYGYFGEYYKKHKRQGNYLAIANGLKLFRDYVSYKSVAIPYKFASDRAGCDWDIILEFIEYYLGEKFDVYIYKLEE